MIKWKRKRTGKPWGNALPCGFINRKLGTE